MRILIVEDDERLASSLHRGLEEAGMAVDTVADGEEALHMAEAAAYDVIVLDVMLPVRDGFAVARGLREKRVDSPILMLTGRGAVEDRVHGLEVGADDYLVKPFALRELIARIKALSRRHLPDRASVLAAGSIHLDTTAHRVTVAGVEVGLTAKEFALIYKPRRQWHTFWNAGDEDARLLEIISPAGFENYFDELIKLFAGGPPEPEAISSLARRYELEVDFASIPRLVSEHGVRFG